MIASDTTGNGVPDVGVANTIDDASPAIQFGREQTYLAIKTLGALEVGAALVSRWGSEMAETCRKQAQQLRQTIELRGWLGSHYAVLLEKSGSLKNPWTNEIVWWDAIPGWDAPHIYTTNTLPILDMVGFDLKLDSARICQDLNESTRRCLREYGCVHSDSNQSVRLEIGERSNLVGSSLNPGWIAMNMLRDLAAIYRGIDFRHLAERYWDWQTTTNSRETCLFFETFAGNSLCFYPRGVVIWGIYDALAGIVVDAEREIITATPRIPNIRVPRLFDADWEAGTASIIGR